MGFLTLYLKDTTKTTLTQHFGNINLTLLCGHLYSNQLQH